MIIKVLRGLEESGLTYDNDATYFDSDKDSAACDEPRVWDKDDSVALA